MTQTIKDRLELLKRDQNAKKEDDPHFTGCGGCGEQYPAICGCRDFNAGVDACLPLLEEVLLSIQKIVAESRTVEEEYGIGNGEATARAQVIADIQALIPTK